MKRAPRLSGYSLYLGPAQPAASKQGDWQARAEGVAEATSMPERSQQRSLLVAGEVGRSAFVKYPG